MAAGVALVAALAGLATHAQRTAHPAYRAVAEVAILPAMDVRALGAEPVPFLDVTGPIWAHNPARGPTLVGLARHRGLAEGARARLGADVAGDDASALQGRIDAELFAYRGIPGELIRIGARAPTPDAAAALASAWAEEFVRYVNELYRVVPGDVAALERLLDDATQAAENGDRRLQAFIADDDAEAIERQLAENRAALAEASTPQDVAPLEREGRALAARLATRQAALAALRAEQDQANAHLRAVRAALNKRQLRAATVPAQVRLASAAAPPPIPLGRAPLSAGIMAGFASLAALTLLALGAHALGVKPLFRRLGARGRDGGATA